VTHPVQHSKAVSAIRCGQVYCKVEGFLSGRGMHESRRAWGPRREAYCRRDAKEGARESASSNRRYFCRSLHGRCSPYFTSPNLSSIYFESHWRNVRLAAASFSGKATPMPMTTAQAMGTATTIPMKASAEYAPTSARRRVMVTPPCNSACEGLLCEKITAGGVGAKDLKEVLRTRDRASGWRPYGRCETIIVFAPDDPKLRREVCGRCRARVLCPEPRYSREASKPKKLIATTRNFPRFENCPGSV